jgi:hypothetical protein
VRRRILPIVCALVVLAFAGLRQLDDRAIQLDERAIEPFASTAATGRLAAPPAPEPLLPAVVPEPAATSPTPAPLTSAWHRHPRPADTATIAHRPAPRTSTGAARPLTIPLLI